LGRVASEKLERPASTVNRPVALSSVAALDHGLGLTDRFQQNAAFNTDFHGASPFLEGRFSDRSGGEVTRSARKFNCYVNVRPYWAEVKAWSRFEHTAQQLDIFGDLAVLRFEFLDFADGVDDGGVVAATDPFADLGIGALG